jgi:phosphomannomutase
MGGRWARGECAGRTAGHCCVNRRGEGEDWGSCTGTATLLIRSKDRVERRDEMEYEQIFGAYDIRGVVGPELDSRKARAISGAYGNYLCPDRIGRFLIGHDTRLSSPALSEAVSIGLREEGHDVVHIGLATTPLVYWYGAEGKFDGSVGVTASHLHPEYNGLKFCERDAKPLSGTHGLPEILAALKNPPDLPPRPISHLLEHRCPVPIFASRLRQRLHPQRALKVGVDAGNGAGGVEAAAVFSLFDALQIWQLNFHPDGLFPSRSSNPLEEGALAGLAETVTKHGLDFGLAFDGDADRAVAVDEQGRLAPPDAIGGLIALHLLEDHPGATILYDLRASRAIAEMIEKAGGHPVRTRVGHAFIKPAMREQQAIFAMELSGHYYYADLHYTDNGLRALIELINVVSAASTPLSEMLAPFQKYPTSGEINLKVSDTAAVLKALEAEYQDAKIDHLDGLSVDYPDWWFNARASHTEPLLRLNIGATTRSRLDEERKKLLSTLDRLMDKGEKQGD